MSTGSTTLDSGDVTSFNQQQNPGTLTSGMINMPPKPFWPQDPALWFLRVESRWIGRSDATDDTKAEWLLDCLNFEQIQEISDVLQNAKVGCRYQQIKDALLKRYTTSQPSRTRRLLEMEAIGDRTPTQFVRHLRNVGGSAANDDILSTLLMKQLPPSIQAVLVLMGNKTPEQLAEAADRVFDIYQPTQCAAIETSSTATTLHQMTAQIAQLQLTVSALQRQVDELSRRQSRGQQRSQSRSSHSGRNRSFHMRSTPLTESAAQPRQQRTPTLCRYHERYGDKARHCDLPCTYTAGNATVNQ